MNRSAEFVAVRSIAMAAVALLAGCTMCPDPYDYSGPVPNGSSPQNDFRARSNGILPIGAAPRPWPPIVRGDSEGRGVQGLVRRSGTPTPAPDDVTVAVAEAAVEPAEARSVLVVVGSEEPEVPSPPRDPWAVVPDFESVPAVSVEVPILTETPGWRQRTPR
jgi:hypothetical protein